MKALRNYLDKIKPNFEEDGKLHAFQSLFDGLETFAFVPRTTSRIGSVNIHDAIDSKRIISFVIIALMPALLFGMYNIGYQNALAAGTLGEATLLGMWWFGFLAVLPKIVVSYAVGLGIEFTVAQWKHEEIQEGFLATGILIPMIVPVTTPLWMLAVAVAASVILAKEIFGGTGMNIFNPALVARAILFFSYPSAMTGDNTVWVAGKSILGAGFDVTSADALSGATPLGMAAQEGFAGYDQTTICNAISGLIPGSVGETSLIAIALGAALLLWTGVASWKTMLSVFVGGAATGWLMQAVGLTPIQWYEHLVLGGFAFGAVFMATDPVTGARTEGGKYIYGLLIGFVAVMVRVMNPGFPEGMMLAILFMNVFAPLIDYCFVQRNISRRAKRAVQK
ncbi:MAG: NADH:ubiquinone reductase (Na(+)-transporting) subunit B [Bacteroidaceae bacterium]|nr:NADH:ubiquinone reductase (Na(+)-transporting) subunit B [Bacteroidaceae bacterium]MBQ4003228.1 NADH:ubiquinone reductase (Na(+)-transporting) subunit B [Bacteroidaceae bacterium]